MIDRRRTYLNAFLSVVQVVVIGGAFLVLYRYLLESIGEELAGVWSLVLAWTSASSIANLGLAGGAVKFVSQYRARGDEARVVDIVQTSALSVAGFLVVVLAALYPLLGYLLAFLIDPEPLIREALAVLPYALASYWLTSTAAVFQSCIDGTHRVYLRNLLLIASTLLYLALAFLLVPGHGLVGLAAAQVLQAGFLFVSAWIVLRVLIPALPLLPYRWNRVVFLEMFRYSINFQVISFWHLFFEPTTKSLLSKFGGVGTVFFFEMAHKMVIQLRALVVTAHQSLVPAIAHMYETDADRVQELYRSSFRLLLFFVAVSLPALVMLTPVISRLWIGGYEERFVLFAVLLSAGWFLNILANPAYFGYLGIGELRWNVRGHAVIGVLNGVLGGALGYVYGGVGVVVGFVAALLTGSSLIALSYHRAYHIRLRDVVRRESLLLGTTGLAGMAAGLLLYLRLSSTWNIFALLAVMLAAYGAAVGVPLWRHPDRRHLYERLLQLLPARYRNVPSA